jgi:hypothetical protein
VVLLVQVELLLLLPLVAPNCALSVLEWLA